MKTRDLSTASGIRREFFALRNGLIADTLRKGGMEQKYIFGLQLPQIKGMATEVLATVSDSDAGKLARELWEDRECRESRLLAIHLMQAAKTSKEDAAAFAADIRTREEADILAFRLVRHLPYAAEIADSLAQYEPALQRYAAEAIRRFIDPQ